MSDEALNDLLDQLPEMAEAVNKFDGEAAQKEALTALLRAWRGEKPVSHDPPVTPSGGQDGSQADTFTDEDKGEKDAEKPEPISPGEIDFHPDDEQHFRDFVEDKQPGKYTERALVAVYYLQQVLELPKVSVDHVEAAFRNADWRLPADMGNTLSQASSRDDWLNSADRENITLTTHGENHVLYDLPESE